MFDQINVHEYPGLANLGSRHLPTMRLLSKRDGVDMEQLGSGLQVKGFQAVVSAMPGGKSG